MVQGKEPASSAGDTGDTGLISGSRRFPLSRKCQPTPVFLPKKIAWTEEPEGLYFTGFQSHLSDLACMHTHTHTKYIYICKYVMIYIFIVVELVYASCG